MERALHDAVRFTSRWAQLPADPDELNSIIGPAITRLAQLARSGNGRALWYFLKLANEIGEGLYGMMEVNREAMRPFARLCARWPMMRSTHPLRNAPDEWLDEIQLGKGVPIQADKYSKWKPDHAADVATQLFFYLNERRAMLGLKPFNADSAPSWWKKAKAALLQAYPKPEEEEFLALICTRKLRYPSQRRREILSKIKARLLHMSCQS